MKKKIKKEILTRFFCEVDKSSVDDDLEDSNSNYYFFPNEEIYYFNNKHYKLKNLQDVNTRESLLFYLYKNNFYLPKIIKRLIFKNVLLRKEKENIHSFNYDIYLLLSYVKNPVINESTQKIIDLDVFRTRIVKNKERNIFFFNIFLNYACYFFQFKYKQGLNEVLALFFYLEGKYFNLVDVYFCFRSFVETFLKEFYFDDEFFFLQISFYLFKILIKYHDPTLSEILERNKMTPEIYASSWFLTLFASKSHFQILSLIYLIFILEKNPFFFFFFSLALLILHRDVFMYVDSSNLPELLSKLNIFNKLFLKKVYALAKYLEKNTPVSFTHKLVFIKNVLIHLTKENTSESYKNKNILMNFFKSIDYMPINSYELQRDLTSGNRHFIFFDVRASWHYGDFRLKDSINLEYSNADLEELKENIEEKKRRLDKKRERRKIKNDKRIYYILKHFDNLEIVGNDKFLFLFLFRNKYNLQNNFSYDDCILLKRFVVEGSTNRSSIINFSALEKEKIIKRMRRVRRMRKRIKKRKKRRNKQEMEKGIKGKNTNATFFRTQKYNLFKTKESKKIDLSFAFQSCYNRSDPMNQSNKYPNVQFKPVQTIGHKYMIHRKQKSYKKCYSDDEALSSSFDFKCFCMKNAFQKISKHRNSGTNGEDSNLTRFFECASNGSKRNDIQGEEQIKWNLRKWKNESNSFSRINLTKDENYKEEVLGKTGEREEEGEGEEMEKKKEQQLEENTKLLMVTNLNKTTFNLYLLIKETVQAHEKTLHFCFNNTISPNKHIVIVYDEMYNDAKNVKKLYFYLVFNLKWKNVSIVEGGINSYHNLVNRRMTHANESVYNNSNTDWNLYRNKNQSMESVEGESSMKRKKENNKRRNDIISKCTVCNPNICKFSRYNQFLDIHICYLCSTIHITKMKKILDEFFYEIYNDQSIFEQFYNFSIGKNAHFNFLSFLHLIEHKREEKKKAQINSNSNKKKRDSEASFSPLTNLFNFIKGRKSEKTLEKKNGPLQEVTQRKPEETTDGNGITFITKEKEQKGSGISNDNRLDTNNDGLFQKKNNVFRETNQENNKEKKQDPFGFNYYWEYYSNRRKKGSVDIAPNKVLVDDTKYAKYVHKDDDNHTLGEKDSVKPEKNNNEKIKSEDLYHVNNRSYNNKWKLEGRSRERKTDYKREEFMVRSNRDVNTNGEETTEMKNESNFCKINKNEMNVHKENYLKSDVYNIYTYIDIICYNNILIKKEDCKIYKCFIIHVYQPLIPHNIRSNNILNNFIEYMKYLHIINKKKKTVRLDPNMYLNCNKVEPRFFFNFSYIPFDHLRKLTFPNSFRLNNFLKEESIALGKGDNRSNYEEDAHEGKTENENENENESENESENENENENESEDNGGSDNEKKFIHKETFDKKSVEFFDEPREENKNNAVLNKSWIKNKPELGMCKLMIYDNLLIIYGTPYLYSVNISSKKKKNGAEREKKKRRDAGEKEEEAKTEKKNTDIDIEAEKKKGNIEKNVSDEFERGNGTDTKEKAISEKQKLNWTSFKKYKDRQTANTLMDIGTLNFIKEKREYTNMKEIELCINFNKTEKGEENKKNKKEDEEDKKEDSDDDDSESGINAIKKEKVEKEEKENMLNKIIVHKYKDLKKKDILFNLDCYKINSINVNWYKVSDSLLKEINKECMLDVYNYYRAHFNLSRNALMAKEEKNIKETQIDNRDQLLKNVSSDILSSAVVSDYSECSDGSDDIDFSFSDYHNLYKDDVKIILDKKKKKRKSSKELKVEREDQEEDKPEDTEDNVEDKKNVAVDVVNVYAIYDLHTIYKITTKKKSATVLYFYFTVNKKIPLAVLNFDNELEAQSCVYAVKQVYAKFAQRK